MAKKFERSDQDKPLGEFGDRRKPKDVDLEKDTINQKDKEENKKK